MYINAASTTPAFIPNYGSACTVLTTSSWRGRGDNGIGPTYGNPPFLQRGHGICSFLGGLWRSFVRPLLWQGAKAVSSDAIVTERNIISDMA